MAERRAAPGIVGLGVPVADYIVRVDRLPAANGACRTLAHSWQPGGKASTALAAAARLGAPCAFVGVVGEDLEGRAHRADLRFHGVDDAWVVVDPWGATPYNLVLADDETHGRCILHSDRRTRGLTPADLDEALLRSARVLLVESGGATARHACVLVRAAGGTVVCDGDRYSDSLEELLSLVDVAIVSEEFIAARSPGLAPFDACRDLARRGPRTVVATLGPRGCVVVSPDGEFAQPALPIPVVDTTGAGDAFHGAYCAALLEGLSTRACVLQASAVAALKCRAIGGRAGLPDRAAVQRFLATSDPGPTDLEERIRRYAKPYGDAARYGPANGGPQ